MRSWLGLLLAAALTAVAVWVLRDPEGPSRPPPPGGAASRPEPPRLRSEPPPPAPRPERREPAERPQEPTRRWTLPPLRPELPRVVSAFQDLPIAGARVELQGAGGRAVRITDERGQFSPPPWEVETVRVTAPGFRPLAGAIRGGVTGKRFRLKPAARLEGIVTTREGPVDWAHVAVGVVLPDEEGVPRGYVWPTRGPLVTRDGGRFRLEGVEPRGRYLLVARFGRLGMAAKADVPPDGPPVILRLGGESVLQVLVTDPHGRPVAGVRAVLTGRPDGLPGEVVVGPREAAYAALLKALGSEYRRESRSTGAAFEGWGTGQGVAFPDLPSGTYTLLLQARGFRPYVRKLRIQPHEVHRHAARLEPYGPAFTGLVTDRAGRPVAGAQVEVLTGGPAYEGYLPGRTGPDGSFTVIGPSPWRAPLQVQVAATGFERRILTLPPQKRRITVVLVREGALAGEVSLAGKEVGSVTLQLLRTRPAPLRLVRHFEVRYEWRRYRFSVPAGTWLLRFSAAGFADAVVEAVEVPEGGEVVVPAVRLLPR